MRLNQQRVTLTSVLVMEKEVNAAMNQLVAVETE